MESTSMEWLSENWGNIVVIAILVAIMMGIVIHFTQKTQRLWLRM